MQPLFRFGLDLTGHNPDNFVGDETHQLSNRRNRGVVPKAGAYFADSLIVVEVNTSRILTRGIHYVPIELNQILSMQTGKDIFGAVLIIDRNIYREVKISYQCVGGEHQQSAQTLFDLLEKLPDDGNTYSWYEIDDKPLEFEPTPHLHAIGEPYGFEKVCHAIDRIQQAISTTDIPGFRNLLSYITDIFQEIDQDNKFKMDAFFGPQLVQFKRQLNKAYYELDFVQNFPTATEEDGRIIARPDTITRNFIRAKYIALNSLIAFKNSVYNAFVQSATTHIGYTSVSNISPDSESILSLTTGSIRTLVSKNNAVQNSQGLNLSIYPQDAAGTDTFVIMKISANKANRGGIYMLMERNGSKLYLAKNSNGQNNEQFVHLRLALGNQYNQINDLLEDHIEDFDNSHDVTKLQIGLGMVENLPVVSMTEILCLDSQRKYITFDLFLLFVKTFMIGKNDSADEDRDGTVNPLEELNIHRCINSILEAEPEPDCICETCGDETSPITQT
jgi:hypothetical protein